MYLGSWKIDDLLTFCVQTQSFSTGVATDADSAPSYRVYEDETGTPLLTGTMATLDAGNTDGFYSEQITLSAANGFEKGKCYHIRIAATVDGVAGAVVRNFQMEAEVDANRVNWANVDNPTTTVGLSGTTVKTATDVEADTQDIQGRLPAALTGDGNIKADTLRIGGTLQTANDVGGDVNDILADTAEMQGKLPTNNIMGSSVKTDKDDEIDAIKAKTDNLPSDPADASVISGRFDTVDTAIAAVPTAAENAAEGLKHDWNNITGEAERCTLNALRPMRNGFSIAGATLTVLKEDDTTPAYTRDLAVDANAVPIVGVS